MNFMNKLINPVLKKLKSLELEINECPQNFKSTLKIYFNYKTFEQSFYSFIQQ